MARLSRHLGSLPLLAKHRINCIRTAIKRNMDVQNYGYSKQMLELLLSKAPPGKQDELRSLVDICVQRGLSNKSIDPQEDPSQFCAATLSRLSTIGYDVCDLCGAKFSALSSPGCIICGMGSIKRSDALVVPVPSPFGWNYRLKQNFLRNSGLGGCGVGISIVQLFVHSVIIHFVFGVILFPPHHIFLSSFSHV